VIMELDPNMFVSISICCISIGSNSPKHWS
jgi:hypothetical protein